MGTEEAKALWIMAVQVGISGLPDRYRSTYAASVFTTAYSLWEDVVFVEVIKAQNAALKIGKMAEQYVNWKFGLPGGNRPEWMP